MKNVIVTISCLVFTAALGQGLMSEAQTTRPFRSVCDRSFAVAIALQRETLKTCNKITAEDLHAIKSLEIYDEKNIFAEGDLEDLTGLQSLLLQGQTTVALPKALFVDLAALDSLTLRYFQFTALTEGLFIPLINLTHISVADTAIEKLPDGVFAQLPRLESVQIYSNKIIELLNPLADTRSKISDVQVSEPRLRAVAPEFLKGLAKLEKLGISTEQGATYFDDFFTYTPSVSSVALTAKAGALRLGASLFRGLSHIKEISLYGYRDICRTPEIFYGLDSLTSLSMQDDGVFHYRTLDESTFKDLRHLKSIQLYQLGLDTLPTGIFRHQDEVETINLYYNNFSEMAADLFDTAVAGGTLTSVDLRGNPLSPNAKAALTKKMGSHVVF